jgi:putative Holliday junction resolvase
MCNALRASDKIVDPIWWGREVPRVSRLLAVDYGTKRLGLAVSDPGGKYALPLETIELPPRARAAAVAERAAERGVETIVVGRPKRAGGEDSALWPEIQKFARALERRGFRVCFEDEAFSSTEAQSLLAERPGERPARTLPADAVAAKVILEQFLARG